jgi:hypothetical protein
MDGKISKAVIYKKASFVTQTSGLNHKCVMIAINALNM